MTVFMPVIVSEAPLSFTDGTQPLLQAVAAVRDRQTFTSPIVVTQARWLQSAQEMVSARFPETLFVTVPDGSAQTVHAALGCLWASRLHKGPQFLMNGSVDRRNHDCVARAVRSVALPVAQWKIVSFLMDGTATGDYAFNFGTLEDVIEHRLPGVRMFAYRSLVYAGSEGNVVHMPNTKFLHDPGSLADVFGPDAPFLAEVAYIQGLPKEVYTPWNTAKHQKDNFYSVGMPQ